MNTQQRWRRLGGILPVIVLVLGAAAAAQDAPWTATTGTTPSAASTPTPSATVPAATATGTTPSAWTPVTPLPPAQPDARPVDVVLTPHPDDETLSLGVWVADAAARGDRVIVVALTDGRGTGARAALATRLHHPINRDEVGAARILELRQATAALGVAPGDVYLAHLDGDRTAGGSGLTQAEAAAVIAAFSARFPQATFATMSWVAERHPDHLAAGAALRQAALSGSVQHAVFAVSRLWWTLPSPPQTQVVASSARVRRSVLAAAAAYHVWAPTRRRYAVGWTSVHQQFLDLVADPVDRVHALAPVVGALPETGPPPHG